MLWQMLVRTFHDYCSQCDQGKDFNSYTLFSVAIFFSLHFHEVVFVEAVFFQTLKMFKQQVVSSCIWKLMCESPVPAFPCTFLAVCVCVFFFFLVHFLLGSFSCAFEGLFFHNCIVLTCPCALGCFIAVIHWLQCRSQYQTVIQVHRCIPDCWSASA